MPFETQKSTPIRSSSVRASWLIAFAVVLGVALPYWALVGQPLVVPR